MTIDKQALREEFHYMQDHYSDPADRERQEIYIAAEALLDELEKAQRANVAQDGHINQQQDRIEQLEKGHQEAAKQISSWRRLAKQNIAEHENVHYADAAEVEITALRQRIAEMEAENNRQVLEVMRLSSLVAELESRTVTVKLPEIERPIDGTGYAAAAGERRYKERVIDALRAAGIKVKGE
ncbi:hypothetical protein E0S27_23400 [Salmonella enterica subsp. enterica serovar Zanzibar]|nr:hypothetical protein [Salmonella enterica subsp. enterica serovar Zanzibar]